MTEALQELLSSGFRVGYAPCNGRWVKCYIPPNAIGPALVLENCHIEGLPSELSRDQLEHMKATVLTIEAQPKDE